MGRDTHRYSNVFDTRGINNMSKNKTSASMETFHLLRDIMIILRNHHIMDIEFSHGNIKVTGYLWNESICIFDTVSNTCAIEDIKDCRQCVFDKYPLLNRFNLKHWKEFENNLSRHNITIDDILCEWNKKLVEVI